jgi:ribose/xylose/arabinose/galactoside ABC-type transport system permease subunit
VSNIISPSPPSSPSPPAPSPRPPAIVGRIARIPRTLAGSRSLGVLVGLVACCIFLSATQDVFLTQANWVNIVRSNTVILLLAVGATFVVITAGIDLSLASTTAASAVALGLAFDAGLPAAVCLTLTLAAGLLLGLVNGALIGWLRISFFVVTLGTLSIYQSVALLASDGDTITLFTVPAFAPVQEFVNGDVGPFPTLLLVWVVVCAVAQSILSHTSYGRAVFAVGSNPEAARLAGIRVSTVLVSVYVIVGLCAAIAAVVQAGRLSGASPHSDPTMLMTVIAAVLIGGTPYTGGEGSVFGTVLGVLFLAVISNGLALSSVSSAWQGAVSGSILILAVGLGVIRGLPRRRRAALKDATE